MNASKGTRRLLSGLMALLVFASCASKKDVDSAEAAIPLEESRADGVAGGSDGDVFADLGTENQKVEIGAATTENIGDQPFYNAVGGESLGRVAYALYGGKRHAAELRRLNPGLSGRLAQGQSVYFSFDQLDPRPMFLTKDMVERYSAELAQKIQGATAITEVRPGETLQAVSQRLYGTTRYWTEIYLLNRDKLSGGFDKVAGGAVLTVVSRPEGFDAYAEVRAEFGSAVASARKETPAHTPPAVETAPPAPATPAVEPKEERLQAGVVDSQVVPPAPTEAPVAPPVKEILQQDKDPSVLSGTNMRRAIYVGLILVITVFAFYMTRPARKQRFDMLDTTAKSTTSRPKLKDQDRDAV
ncbi:MAG: hypothetical protein HUU37_05300 [Bdellovibrionales bacterium]|nr:hypothetical protein [Bdellovibrionales bacterium]